MQRIYSTAWFSKTSTWDYVYVVLARDKLYVFRDSSCKIGEQRVTVALQHVSR